MIQISKSDDELQRTNYLDRIAIELLYLWGDALILYGAVKSREATRINLFDQATLKYKEALEMDPNAPDVALGPPRPWLAPDRRSNPRTCCWSNRWESHHLKV